MLRSSAGSSKNRENDVGVVGMVVGGCLRSEVVRNGRDLPVFLCGACEGSTEKSEDLLGSRTFNSLLHVSAMKVIHFAHVVVVGRNSHSAGSLR